MEDKQRNTTTSTTGHSSVAGFPALPLLSSPGAAGEQVNDNLPASDLEENIHLSAHLKKNILETSKNPFQVVSKFLTATNGGFRILSQTYIVCFEYTKQTKQWTAILTDNTTCRLKRKTTAGDILSYSPFFAQINQHQIINLTHLTGIYKNKCIMSLHTGGHKEELTVSRSCLKDLIQKFRLI
ncbi:MAG: hypothetical protein QM751_10160 [Paludibacteraceae bacterium]